MNIRILIYEDNDDLRDSLEALLRSTHLFEIVGSFTNCAHVQKQVTTHQPDIVLMDIDMPEVNGIEGLKIIHQHSPQTLVLMLTVFEDENNIFDAILNGASGYLLKRTPPATIVEAIIELYNGGAPMTPVIARKVIELSKNRNQKTEINSFKLNEREIEVLKLVTAGSSVKMVADELNLSPDAIKSRIKNIYEKLHVHNMPEAVAKAFRSRIVE